jgi:hypothetical protein
MLRALVLVLALANAGYFAWTQGWLDGVVGVPAHGSQQEPERLARQVRPDTVKVLPPAAGTGLPPPGAGPAASAVAGGASAAAPAEALACLESGPYAPAEVAAATAALQAVLPPGSWADVKVDRPGNWLVYMGRYGEAEMLAKKKDEISRMRLPFEEVRNPPALSPGLSLGRFDDQAGAERLLAQLATRGIKSARVVEAFPPAHLLRVAAADPALQQQLADLKAEALLGKGFAACAKGAAN